MKTTTNPGTHLNRRQFIQSTAKTAAVLSVASTAPFVSRGRVLGANDKIGIGFIGVGGRGRNHLDLAMAMSERPQYNVGVVAVNDAYGPRRRSAAEVSKSKAYAHHQELLADEDVDIVCIATPDRLHVPQALDAIRAGKDVYCEKPMGHWSQFALSKQFYQETLKLKRIVQVGNQGNSSQAWRKVADLLKEGAIGRVSHVQAGYYREGDWGERMPIPDANAQPGAELDWEGFLGDAPKVAFTVDRFFSWRKYLDYAGGPCTDLFPHVFTPFVRLFGLTYPSRVVAGGGILKYDTYDREVPDTFNMCLDYADKKLAVNLTCTLANDYQSEPVIRGDQGTITLQNPAWEAGFDTVTIIPKKGEPKVVKGEKPNSTLKHWENFLACVRSREKPVSDVEFGFHVQAALNMAMLSFLKNKTAQFDFAREEILL